MSNPLAGDKDRQLDVEFHFHHLKRRGMPVAQQVADQTSILGDLLRSFAVADTGRLDDGGIGAHIVDQANKTMIENLKLFVQ